MFDGKTIVFQGRKYKTRLEKQEALKILKCWQPQGIFNAPKEFEHACKSMQKLTESLNTLIESNAARQTADIVKNLMGSLPMLLSDLSVSFLNILNCLQNQMSVLNVGTFLINLYHMFNKIRLLLYGSQEEVFEEALEPQFVDSFILGYLSTCLPSKIMMSLRSMNLFTNSKFLDDHASFYNVISDVRKFIDVILEHDWFPARLSNLLKKILDYTPFNLFSCVLYKIRYFNDVLRRNRHEILDSVTQQKILELEHELDVSDYSKRTIKNKIILADIDYFKSACKTIKSYLQAIRTEPALFVFEGPPGIGKTYMMNVLSKTYRTPIYTHIIPDRESAKDFYDDYNNEEIFVMDDIGQMSTAQWSPIMNMISSTKMPLPCAQAELKNSKYLTSRLVLCTTNQIQNISPLRTDGISDVQALHRRCNIFEFKDGKITFKSYDLKRSNFVIGYGEKDQQFCDFCATRSYQPKFVISQSDPDLYIWLRLIIDFKLNLANRIKDNQDVFVEDVSSITDLILDNPFKPQSGFEYWNTIRDCIMENFSNLYEYIVDLIRENFGSIVNGLIITAIANLILYGFSKIIHSMYSFFKPQTHIETSDPFELCEKEIDQYKMVDINHDGVIAVSKNVFSFKFTYININDAQNTSYGCGVISGNTIITPSHSLYDHQDGTQIYLTVTQRGNVKTLIYDHVPVEIVFKDSNNDLLILKLPNNLPSYVKNISKHFKNVDKRSHPTYLVTPFGVCDIRSHLQKGITGVYKYEIKGASFMGKIHKDKDIFYSIQAPSLCGSIVLDENSNILGMHVAGNVAIKTGVSMLWDDKCRYEIQQSLNAKCLTFDLELGQNKIDGASVARLDNTFGYKSFVFDKTKYVPSEIHGVYPTERVPANLNSFGKGTLKEMAKKNYKEVHEVDVKALQFAKQVVSGLIPRYNKIDDSIVIKGDGKDLPPLNMKTSGGFGYGTDKSQYVDYENGVFKDNFKKTIDNFYADFKHDIVKIQDCLAIDTLKDELRDIHKADTPRVFRASNLLQTVLCKRYFGDLLRQLHRDKWNNGIMIGINPFVEFEKIYDMVKKFGDQVFDGDYKNWDGNMLPQFQFALKQLLLDKYDGPEKDVVELLLHLGINTPTLSMNEILMTTHGLPSGWFLTADFNSLVNIMYIAYVFYLSFFEEFKRNPTISEYTRSVMPFVYGDDCIIAVSANCKSFFNGPIFAKQIAHTGVLFTPAHKGEWDYETKSIDDCQFLKRGFKYHNLLGQIVSPLDLKTVFSTLNYVSDKEKNLEITLEKINNFQREIFLHPDVFEIEINRVKEYCTKQHIRFSRLDLDYLIDLYKNNPEEFSQGLLKTF